MASRYTERHGLVTSYDPVNYLAKVTFQPDGQVSSWLPIETGHIGNGYGIVVGLTPGAGGQSAGAQSGGTGGQQSSSGNQGDQVIVRFQEGDFESGKIVQRVHSINNRAPVAQSGEMIFYTSGKKIMFSDNKGNTGSFGLDGSGNWVITVNNYTVNANGNATINVGGSATVTAKGALNLNGSPINFNGGGPSTPAFTVPG